MRTRYLLELAALLPLLIFLTHWCCAVLITLKRGAAIKCPSCDNSRTRWSMPRIQDRLLPSFVLARRCESCQKRFYTARSVNYAHKPRPASAVSAVAPARTRSAPSGAMAAAGR